MALQYYTNGYKVGDPLDYRPPSVKKQTPKLRDLPKEVDVLIVGCGPAGLMLATQLSAFADISTCIIDQKSGPLQVGQADGVSGRSIEIFQAFDFAERVIKEAYFLKAISFWRYDEAKPNHIYRANKAADGRSVYSEFPHVILNQARVHDFLLDRMKKSPAQLHPDYDRRLIGINVSNSLNDEATKSHSIIATVERLDEKNKGVKETIKARYMVGSDGARSQVRELLSIPMCGDSANKAWGVMDLLLVTDFPDIRIKSVIQSNEGNIMIIPREGGHLVRFYIEMDKLKKSERVAHLKITSEQLIDAAKRIFRPYTLEVKEVAWWSVYEIGQRVADHFDNTYQSTTKQANPSIFITGDACHTHSPKAGQGMNVSMHDSFNLGWKLAAVIRGQSSVEILKTYTSERRAIAQQLIDFDRKLAKAFSTPLKNPTQESTGNDEITGKNQSTPTKLQQYVVQLEGFMSGTMTQYPSSLLIGKDTYQHLATGFPIGKRFHSSLVTRLIDAREMHLGHINKADGRWRIFAFDRKEKTTTLPSSAIKQLSDFLANSTHSPIQKYTPKNQDMDSVIDWAIVLQTNYFELDMTGIPSFFTPAKGVYGLHDCEKIFCADMDNHDNLFDCRGIDRQQGCLLIVRPDQHIANILPLSLDGFTKMAAFFDQFMTPQ